MARGGQDFARQEFNHAIVRPMTAVGMFIYLLMLVAGISESMELERARDTWTVLLSTPLSGREILGGKMAAAVVRFRFVAAVMVVLWVAGLVVGSLHPLGFLAALAVLFVSTRAGVALGAYAASTSKEKPAAMSWVTSVLILLTIAGPAPWLFLHEPGFVVLGACSPPFVAMLSLATYGEVREVVLGSGIFNLFQFNLFQAYGRSSGLDLKWLVATCVLGLIGPSVCAVWLKRAAFNGFDAAVGRPCRAKPTASLRTIDIEPTVM